MGVETSGTSNAFSTLSIEGPTLNTLGEESTISVHPPSLVCGEGEVGGEVLLTFSTIPKLGSAKVSAGGITGCIAFS